MRLVAIDPGDVHNGVAWFLDGECVGTRTMDPRTFRQGIWDLLREHRVDQLVIEEWRLYSTHARKQIGSDFPTSRCIGMIQGFAWIHEIPIQMQGASIKKVCFAQARGRGIDVPGATQHEKDAWAHGFYFHHHDELGTEAARMSGESAASSMGSST